MTILSTTTNIRQHERSKKMQTILVSAFILLISVSLANSQTLSYQPNKLTLQSGQSLETDEHELLLNADCNLVLYNHLGQIAWTSGSTNTAATSCTNPTFSFTSNGALVTTGTVNGVPGTVYWSAGITNSASFSFSGDFPYLSTHNADQSLAWSLANTLALTAPDMVYTMGFNNPSYADQVPTARVDATPFNPGDLVDSFLAPNNKQVTVTVHAPVTKTTYNVAPMASGGDPYTYFTTAVSNAGSASVITFPSGGVYNFSPKGCQTSGVNWPINNATDVVIDGNGSTLSFSPTLVCTGIQLNNSARVVLKNFIIEWQNLQTASLGTITGTSGNSTSGYHYNLQLDSQYVNSGMRLFYESIFSWDQTNNVYSISNANHISYGSNPNNANGYTPTLSPTGYAQNVPSYSASFKLGDRVIVHQYQSEADCIFADQGQDVTFDNITFYSCPGSAIVSNVTGLHITNSTVTRAPGQIISITGDAFHLGRSPGDIVIDNNFIGYEGDDGINLNTFTATLGASGSTNVTVNTVLPMTGDVLGLFNANMQYDNTKSINVSSETSNLPSDTSEITLNQGVPTSDAEGFLMDFAYPNARYIIRNNQFEYSPGHGLLLQTSYGLVDGNSFTSQTYAAMDFDTCNFCGEGPGAQNVLVIHNTILSNGGTYGAIMAARHNDSAQIVYVGGSEPPSAPPVPGIHQNIIFAANSISNVPAAGFYISSANNVVLANNSLQDTNEMPISNTVYNVNFPIVINDASCVLLYGNSIPGANPVEIDTNSVKWVVQQ